MCEVERLRAEAAAAPAAPAAADLATIRRLVSLLPPTEDGFTWGLARYKTVDRPDLVIEDATPRAKRKGWADETH